MTTQENKQHGNPECTVVRVERRAAPTEPVETSQDGGEPRPPRKRRRVTAIPDVMGGYQPTPAGSEVMGGYQPTPAGSEVMGRVEWPSDNEDRPEDMALSENDEPRYRDDRPRCR